MQTLPLFIHLAGIIIALGSVTVIDTLGFISRTSKPLTQVTISAHHVTKPLIWLGTTLMVIGWVFLLGNTIYSIEKTLLMIILICNGLFLSLYISPRLDMLIGKKTLVPSKLQIKITISFIVSFISWWLLVYLTVLQLVR